MNFTLKQFSSLEKIRSSADLNCEEIGQKTVMQGERLSYQICIQAANRYVTTVSVESELADYITLYKLKDVCMDQPTTTYPPIEDYITHEPGMMPDILIPLEESKNRITLSDYVHTVWVRVDVPKDFKPGKYSINVAFTIRENKSQELVGVLHQKMIVEVISAIMPKQQFIYTRWFYADCIATTHNVEIYSEKHWELIDKYMAAASDVGINMLLIPTHTPPLDTAEGTARPCVQLVDIEKKGTQYEFTFDKFHRFINLCKKNGIEYFEIAHMFSQWGAKSAPNIMVTENGKTDYMFGWHVASSSTEYMDFLKQYIAAIFKELEVAGISQKTYFHISDEPTLNNLNTYKTASELLRSLTKGCKTLDALSNYEFYENGLVKCPVTSISHAHDFLKHAIEELWVYYCCVPQSVFPNSFMAMPSYRIRILGLLCYKYNIKGFLHWGFNFYNSAVSLCPINPYLTTSANRTYPSGDPFIVYPGKDCVYNSIRGEITYDAIQDINICMALEEKIGRDAVVKMIDDAAGFDLRFDSYPKCNTYLEGLRAKMLAALS